MGAGVSVAVGDGLVVQAGRKKSKPTIARQRIRFILALVTIVDPGGNKRG
jgi:hypothetical protein